MILLMTSAVVFFSVNRDVDFFSRTALFSMTSLGFALLMPAAMDSRAPKSSIIGSFWRKVALWSYSLYLSNLLIFNLIQAFWLDTAEKTILNAILANVVFIGASVLISALVYRHYELPVMELRDGARFGHGKKWRLKRA